ncbi:MAG: hypothetical protein ABI614_23340 [Planctomycetota bacterium]
MPRSDRPPTGSGITGRTGWDYFASVPKWVVAVALAFIAITLSVSFLTKQPFKIFGLEFGPVPVPQQPMLSKLDWQAISADLTTSEPFRGVLIDSLRKDTSFRGANGAPPAAADVAKAIIDNAAFRKDVVTGLTADVRMDLGKLEQRFVTTARTALKHGQAPVLLMTGKDGMHKNSKWHENRVPIPKGAAIEREVLKVQGVIVAAWINVTYHVEGLPQYRKITPDIRDENRIVLLLEADSEVDSLLEIDVHVLYHEAG